MSQNDVLGAVPLHDVPDPNLDNEGNANVQEGMDVDEAGEINPVAEQPAPPAAAAAQPTAGAAFEEFNRNIAELLARLSVMNLTGTVTAEALTPLVQLLSLRGLPGRPEDQTPAGRAAKAKPPNVWEGDAESEALSDWLFKMVLFLTSSATPKARWVLTSMTYLGQQPLAHAKQLVTEAMLAAGNISVSWDDFVAHMKLFAGGKTPTQLSVLLELFVQRTDKSKPVCTSATLNTIETLFGKFEMPLSDVTKIGIVWRAIHPELRPLVAYQVGGQEWPSYEAFRTNLVSRAAHFDKEWNAQLKRRDNGDKGSSKGSSSGNGNGKRPHKATGQSNSNNKRTKANDDEPKVPKCRKCNKPGHYMFDINTDSNTWVCPKMKGIPDPVSAPISDSDALAMWLEVKRGLSDEVKRVCFGTHHTYDPFNAACGLTDPGHMLVLSDALRAQTCEAAGDKKSHEACSTECAGTAAAAAVDAVEQAQEASGVSAAEVSTSTQHEEAVEKGAAAVPCSWQPVVDVPLVQSEEAVARTQPAESSGRTVVPVPDRVMLRREVFATSVQQRLQRTCNLDACASGQSDALCDAYCTECNSFLTHQLQNDDCVWIHAPLSLREVMIKHYKQQKATNPRLSACILLSAKRSPDLLQLTAGMTQLAYFARGADVFYDPHADKNVRTKADLAVWYDPPAVQPTEHVQAEPAPVPTVAAGSTPTNVPTRHRMQLRGVVAGVRDVPVLLDPGAEDGPAYISRAFCELHSIAVRPRFSEHVQGWGSATLPVHGDCVITLKLGKFVARVSCVVTDNPTAFPLILGDDFLHAHKAVLNYNDRQCTLVHSGKHYCLPMYAPAQSPASSAKRPGILSYTQAKRFARPGVHYLLAVVRPVDEDTDVPSSGTPAAEPVPGSDPLPEHVVQQIISEYPTVFTDKAPHGGSKIHADVETIPLTDNRPTMRPMFRYSPLELAEMERQVKELLDQGYIKPSSSPYGAPVLFVKKPRSDELRMVIDYRALNKLTERNAYPLPRIDVLLDHLAGSKVFSLIDLRQAYHQIQLCESDVPKTAFRTPFGHYEFITLSFGLVNAPAVFQGAMNRIFSKYLYKFLLVYLDDCLIFSKSAEEHEQHLRLVLDVLKEHQLTAAVHKCTFNQAQVLFLGHVISADGVKADPAKVKAILDYPKPSDVTGLRSFLGMTNYFRKFVYGYARIVHPLTDMLRNPVQGKGAPSKHAVLRWSEAADAAFTQIKQALASAPVLALPDWSEGAVFDMICDASYQGLAGILMQKDRPIAFESRKLNAAERNYSATDLEMLAVVYTVRKWRCYIEGREARVFTDHKPNTFFDSANMLSRTQARWVEALQGFRLQWNYKPGISNIADPLSRNPVLLFTLSSRRVFAALRESPDFLTQVRSGYLTDPWFTQKSTERVRKQLTVTNGLYYMGDRLAVPAAGALRTACMAECHDTPYCGHVGRTKTLHNAQRYFWWPGMTADVSQYVATCDSCQRVHSRNCSQSGLLQPLPMPQDTWQSVSVDFVTSLPATAEGFTAVVVFVDRLSKMVRLAPCQDTVTAEGCADLFIDTVFKSHGVPEQLVSDRDTRFTSEFWAALTARMGVTRAMSSAFHPQTDGQTERVNRVMEDMLRHFVDPTQSTWAKLLPLVEFAINDSWHESVQAIPFVLNYGKRPALPLDWILRGEGATTAAASADPTVAVTTRAQRQLEAVGVAQTTEVPAGTTTEPAPEPEPAEASESSDGESDADPADTSAEATARKAAPQHRAAEVIADITAAVVKAKKCFHAAQQRQKRLADQRRADVHFAEGEQVLLSTKNLTLKMQGSNKLLPRFIGPFKIAQQVNAVAYRLELPPVLKIHDVFHVSLLKQYRPSGRVQPPPLPILIDGVLEFEVEAILKHRKRRYGRGKPKVQYLVKWLGYGEEHNSWEPEANVCNCPLRVNEYWARVAHVEQQKRDADEVEGPPSKRRKH